MNDYLSFQLWVPVVAVVVAAITDLRSFKIYNVLSLPLLVSGMIYHGATGGMDGLGQSLLGAVFGFGVLLPLYLTGGMGGGDVKLLAGVGSWLGLPQTFLVFIASSLAAGVYALCLILCYQTGGETVNNLKIIWSRALALDRPLPPGDRVEGAVQLPGRRGRLIPFGVMIAVGLLAVLALSLLGWKW